MAEFSKGILGGFSGKVGTVVGANWRGKDIMRSLPTKKKREATPAQSAQRAKFKLVVGFMSPLRAITSKYFGEYQGTKSRTDLSVSHQLMEAVVDNNGVFELDYSKVVITKGVLPSVLIQSSAIESNELKLTWTSNAGTGLAKATDKIMVVIYSQSNAMFYVIDGGATRDVGTLTAAIPNGWTAADNSVWLCFVDEDGKYCSTSEYLGEL